MLDSLFLYCASQIDENVKREIINHRSLRHPNIVRFKEVSIFFEVLSNFLRLWFCCNVKVFRLSTTAIVATSATISCDCVDGYTVEVFGVVWAAIVVTFIHNFPQYDKTANVFLKILIFMYFYFVRCYCSQEEQSFICNILYNFSQVILTPTHLAIVMEYASGGELFERICNAGRFTEDEVLVYFVYLFFT